MHDGHRMRMKNRYLKEGLDNFEPHEILELLLFFAIPRRDVNEFAHDLIRHFGSVANVFEADVEELKKVEGIGENTALLLNMIPHLSRAYRLSKWNKNICLGTVDATGRYAVSMFIGKIFEEFAIICMDSGRNLCYSGTIMKGTTNETPAYPRLIVQEALKHNAQNVVLTHNHPNGCILPSEEDKITTARIVQALEAISINVIDHIIVSGEQYYSMAQMGLM